MNPPEPDIPPIGYAAMPPLYLGLDTFGDLTLDPAGRPHYSDPYLRPWTAAPNALYADWSISRNGIAR